MDKIVYGETRIRSEAEYFVSRQSERDLIGEKRKKKCRKKQSIEHQIFFITDQVEKGNVVIDYCATEDMIGDFMTKPLQGEKFKKFRKVILGE